MKKVPNSFIFYENLALSCNLALQSDCFPTLLFYPKSRFYCISHKETRQQSFTVSLKNVTKTRCTGATTAHSTQQALTDYTGS